MPKITSYQAQLALAAELRKSLDELQQGLEQNIQDIVKKACELHDAGMMEETYKDFAANYMAETIKKIKSVIIIVNERDIPFVNEYMGRLDWLKEQYGNA